MMSLKSKLKLQSDVITEGPAMLSLIWPFMICCSSICRVWTALTGSSPACRFILWMERCPPFTTATSLSSRYSTLLVCSMMALETHEGRTETQTWWWVTLGRPVCFVPIFLITPGRYDGRRERGVTDDEELCLLRIHHRTSGELLRSPRVRCKVVLHSAAVPDRADGAGAVGLVVAVLLLHLLLEVTCKAQKSRVSVVLGTQMSSS